ncbi:MAG: tetratricopeptide repeat protein [Bacteroidia bacterium]
MPVLILLLLHTVCGAAQQEAAIDSLLQAYPEQQDSTRIETLKQIVLYYRKTDPRKALRHAEELLAEARRMNWNRGKALGYQLIGVANNRLGEYGEALDAYMSSLAIQEGMGDSLAMATTYHNIVGVYIAQEQYEEALVYFEKILPTVVVQNDTLGIADTYMGMAICYANLQVYDEALQRYQEARRLYSLAGDRDREGMVTLNMGVLWSKVGNRPEAINSYDQALRIKEALGDTAGICRTLNALAASYIQARNSVQANRVLDRVETLVQRRDFRIDRMDYFLYRAQNDSLLGDFAGALQHFQQYNLLKDSIFNEDKNEQIAKMQAMFERDQQEQENQLLHKDRNLKELQLRAQRQVNRIQRIGLLAVLMVLTTIGVLAFRLYLSYQREQAALSVAEARSQELAALNQTKDQWFSIITHDFRSPLTFLQSALTLINEGSLSASETRMLTHELESRVKRTSSMLDNLLYWAQLNFDGLKPRPRNLDLQSILREEVTFWRPMADKKGIEIREQCGKLSAIADRDMIQLVARNLIANAVKFTPKGGSVAVACGAGETGVWFSVSDTGRGISPDHLARLFRLNDPNAREGTNEEKGTGLGLWLCKRFIEINGGQIAVESTEGHGSVFTVHLP